MSAAESKHNNSMKVYVNLYTSDDDMNESCRIIYAYQNLVVFLNDDERVKKVNVKSMSNDFTFPMLFNFLHVPAMIFLFSFK